MGGASNWRGTHTQTAPPPSTPATPTPPSPCGGCGLLLLETPRRQPSTDGNNCLAPPPTLQTSNYLQSGTRSAWNGNGTGHGVQLATPTDPSTSPSCKATPPASRSSNSRRSRWAFLLFFCRLADSAPPPPSSPSPPPPPPPPHTSHRCSTECRQSVISLLLSRLQSLSENRHASPSLNLLHSLADVGTAGSCSRSSCLL